jgi:hypothetical protein
MSIDGVDVRITSHPDADRVTITIGEGCEITLAAYEAIQFALLLLNVASETYRAHLGAGQTAPALGTERVM